MVSKHINELNKKHKKGQKHKGFNKIGDKFNNFGKGVVKRTDKVGKFGGKLLQQQSSAVSGLLGGLSNPLVLIAIAGVGFIVLTRK